MSKENARGMQDDTISREQAIDAVRATLLAWSYMPEWRDNKIIEAIEQLPLIQPKTTTMTVGRTKGEITMWYECDNCGEPVDQSDNYCRNCGGRFKKDG